MGLTLVHRDLSTMHLRTPYGEILVFSILQIFPFTSETKRMGIIVKVSNPGSRFSKVPIINGPRKVFAVHIQDRGFDSLADVINYQLTKQNGLAC